MEGLATYAGTILTITVDKTNGAGTIASWNFNIVGQPGAGDQSVRRGKPCDGAPQSRHSPGDRFERPKLGSQRRYECRQLSGQQAARNQAVTGTHTTD
jgi:hypothetical protein